MGTFTIRLTDAAPVGQKEGGNVVAFFCTPDLEVLHAVGGALAPDEFLRQAEWAVRLAERLGKAGAEERKTLASKAHAEEAAKPIVVRWNAG